MRIVEEHRWLSALAVLAALVPLSPDLLAQPAAEAPASAQQFSQATITSQAPPTPEEIGDALMTHQRYQAAIAAYQKAPSNSAGVINKMGIAYQMMFNVEEAMRCYKASLKIDPANPHVYNNLGTVYDEIGAYRSAERMYRKALRLNPSSSLVLKNLGSDQFAQHRFKQGWETYKAALALDPTVFEDSGAKIRVTNPASISERGAMNYYMAKGCVRAGMTDRAIEYLRMALNEGFTNPKKIIADSEFAGLRGLPAFERLLAAQSNP
ncbi:MAG: tetratricopeptide repeat protein [Terracidiphilus sp.]|jgi:tetratricopeptide (TPR) repeat protein